MKTSDIFKINRDSRRINESMERIFGRKINLESFNLQQLEDARNKLRTQISQVRSESSFNENLDNEAYSQAQFMLDAINSEIAQRQEFISDAGVATVETTEEEVEIKGPYETYIIKNTSEGPVLVMYDLEGAFADQDGGEARGYFSFESNLKTGEVKITDVSEEGMDGNGYFDSDAAQDIAKEATADFVNSYGTEWEDIKDEAEGGMEIEPEEPKEDAVSELSRSTVKSYAEKKKERIKQSPPESKHEVGRDLKGVKGALERLKGEKPTSESVNTGENMTKLNEGEIQQASAIVTAKTMVDRVGRWIEELSGMENDTLLQLGDSIRDEMSQEQAKQFISTCAPAIQSALENLKQTRETLASGVRQLTGEEQGAEMLGAEPEGDEELGGMDDLSGEAEPDAMNAPDEFGDEFAAAEPAAGGAEAAGRAKRESIEYSNKLLKVLAG